MNDLKNVAIAVGGTYVDAGNQMEDLGENLRALLADVKRTARRSDYRDLLSALKRAHVVTDGIVFDEGLRLRIKLTHEVAQVTLEASKSGGKAVVFRRRFDSLNDVWEAFSEDNADTVELLDALSKAVFSSHVLITITMGNKGSALKVPKAIAPELYAKLVKVLHSYK